MVYAIQQLAENALSIADLVMISLDDSFDVQSSKRHQQIPHDRNVLLDKLIIHRCQKSLLRCREYLCTGCKSKHFVSDTAIRVIYRLDTARGDVGMTSSVCHCHCG